jgi:lysosomal Pro-X carboxypeptidase
MDHFGPSPGYYGQRYFINDSFYQVGGPLFFYLGNEADVTLYVNATGLMWEHAAEFGALVVFAEHRYYGKSQLFPDDPVSNLQYLSVEQALMDYVTLIDDLKRRYEFKDDDAVIGFGGSYGGMLASWARFQYPHVWDGVIAGSAPIVTFEFENMEQFFDPDFYAQGMTYDVTLAAGASEFCEANLRKAFSGEEQGLLTNLDPSMLRSAFRICDSDDTKDEDIGWSTRNWINEALSYMAMGNFPYPSSYILNGAGELPAFPVWVACEPLANDMTDDDQMADWLEGLASFAGVYYNYTGTLECNTLSAPVNKESQIVNTLWNYQYCAQIFQVLGQKSTEKDMLWDEPWDGDATATNCMETYGFVPDRYHFPLAYGTPVDWAREASNIVWSQGEYDPWRGGGVVEDLNDSLRAVVIPEAAHHLDLFFSHQDDTDAVIEARKFEMGEVRKWVNEKRNTVTAKRHSIRAETQ